MEANILLEFLELFSVKWHNFQVEVQQLFDVMCYYSVFKFVIISQLFLSWRLPIRVWNQLWIIKFGEHRNDFFFGWLQKGQKG